MINKISILFCIIFLNFSIVNAQNDKSLKFVKYLYNGSYKKAHSLFSKEVKSQLSVEKLKQIMGKIESSNGNFESYHPNCKDTVNSIISSYTTLIFKKSVMDIKLAFNEKSEIIGFLFVSVKNCSSKYKLPNYKSEYKYFDSSLLIKTKEGVIKVTLTAPENRRFDKIVLLVSGSGPNDINSSIGQTQIFRDLSIGLANKGVTSIRFIKFQNLTQTKSRRITFRDEYLDDITIILSYLKENFKSSKKYLLGHSLGGLAISHFTNDSINGLIYMACNSSRMDSLILSQTKYIFSLDSSLSENENKILNKMENEISIINDSLGNIKDTSIILAVPASYWKSIKNINLNYLMSLNTRLPKLFLQGERDYQVGKKDFNRWGNLCISHTKVKFKTFTNLNHVFIAGRGFSYPNEYNNPANVEQSVIDEIVDFIESY